MTDRTKLICDFCERYGEVDLPTICIGLRMSCNGAAGPWGNVFLEDVVAYLEKRIKLWHEPSDTMDNHVKGMCQQAIWIGRAELAERQSRGDVYTGLDGEGWK